MKITKFFTEKIIKTIEKYKDDTTSTIARIIGKHCNRESLNNVKKEENANRTKNMFNLR